MKLTELTEATHRILYLSGDGNYTHVHFLDGTQQVFSRTINLVVADLPDFMRIHRGYAVNLNFVTLLRRPDPKTMEVLVGRIGLPVSRRRQAEVRKRLELFAFGSRSPIRFLPTVAINPIKPGRTYVRK